MIKLLPQPLARWIAAHRDNTVVRKVGWLAAEYVKAWRNFDYDPATNGEIALLDRMRRFPLKTLFDVGANQGCWTLAVRERFPDAEVHAFEVVPATRQALADAVGATDKVRIVPLGLGSAPGSIGVYYYPEAPALSTALDYPHHSGKREQLSLPVTTGTAYMREFGITHIDFLKIDVEGMEMEVLRGFDSAIRAGQVDVIQFEYGKASILNKILLRDYWLFWRERGFVMGKIYPRCVDFKEYTLDDEDFIGPNFLACRLERQDYIRALRNEY